MEEEKNFKSKIDVLKNKLKTSQDKNEKFQAIIDEQKVKIEKLIINKNQQNEKNKMKEKILEMKNSQFKIDFDLDQENRSEGESKGSQS